MFRNFSYDFFMSLLKSINFRLLFKFLGILFMVISGLQLVTLGIALYFDEPEWIYFFISIAISFGVGIMLFLWGAPGQKTTVSIRDSFIIIFAVWLLVPIAGMLPFYLATPIDSVIDALFETYAGFTTTGFTNLAKYDVLPKSIIFWKSIIQWLGGMGLLIFIIALFPLAKKGEIKTFFSDIQDTSYKPLHYKVGGTARRLWFIYFIFTITGIIALLLAGQNWFDAFCLSLSSISTAGGISNNGDLTYLNLATKSVLIVLMFVGGANYFFVYQIFKKQKNISNDEFMGYIKVFFFSSLFIIVAQSVKHGFNLNLIFESIFNTISIVSTTGFHSTQYFDSEILSVWILLFFLMLLGSSTGSSGGGINIYRLVILFRTLHNYIKTIIHPNIFYQVKFNKEPVNTDIINRIYAFFILYIITFFAGVVILSLFDFDFNNAIGLSAASLSNSGPSVFLLNGYTDLSTIHTGSKIILIFLMIIGRIDLFPFLLLFSKSYWKP